MNKVIPIVIAGVSGLAVGAGVGYFIGHRRAYIAAGKEIDQWKEEIHAEYDEALARATKSGPYSTPSEAASVLIPSTESGLVVPSGDSEPEAVEGPKHVAEPSAAFVDGASELEPEFPEEGPDESADTDRGYAVVPERDESEPAVDIKSIIESYKDKPIPAGGVTYPGQELLEPDDADEVDLTVPSVPGWVTVRDPLHPYLISIDEFMENDDYTKTELVWFSDSVLIDSKEHVVPEGRVDALIGLNNLDKWGQGTTDPNQVYIRNEVLGQDIELTRDDDTYVHQILGQRTQAQVDAAQLKAQPQKFRESDDS